LGKSGLIPRSSAAIPINNTGETLGIKPDGMINFLSNEDTAAALLRGSSFKARQLVSKTEVLKLPQG
jgi:hypothetical protein